MSAADGRAYDRLELAGGGGGGGGYAYDAGVAGDSTPSAFRTPEQQAAGDRRPVDASARDEHAPAGGEGAFFARDFAQSHFRRRNRLESRLEELQRDVANLTTKLRAGSARSASSLAHPSLDRSTDADEPTRVSRTATPASAAKKSLRSAEAPTRRKNTPSELATPTGRINRAQSNSVRTLRELHSVTTERDQLRFELDKTKRAMATIEKKYQDAKRVKQAYEKLKTHCDSLQDSLELSEKIRVRQKKLLQQLQRQLEQQQSQQVDLARKAGHKNLSRARDGSATPGGRRAKTPTRHSQDEGILPRRYEDEDILPRRHEDEDADLDTRIPREAREDYDILNSLVSPASTLHRSVGNSRHQDQAEQTASEPTAARSRPKPKVSAVPSNPYRSEFDKLLRTERPLQSRYTIQRPRQISIQQRLQEQRASQLEPRSARSTAMQSSTRLQPPARRKSPANRPKNSFLAPTQASLSRMQQVFGRHGDQRRPFMP